MNEYSMVVVGLGLSFSDIIDAGLWRFDGVHATILLNLNTLKVQNFDYCTA